MILMKPQKVVPIVPNIIDTKFHVYYGTRTDAVFFIKVI